MCENNSHHLSIYTPSLLKGGSQDKNFRVQESFILPVFSQHRIQRRRFLNPSLSAVLLPFMTRSEYSGSSILTETMAIIKGLILF